MDQRTFLLMPGVSSLVKIMCLGILVLVSFSCSEELEEELAIISEEALLVGSDNIRLSGRIISTKDISLSDHGFELATENTFSSPSVISLGELFGNGAFVGSATGLLPGTDYWWRSYIVLDGEKLYSEAKEVKTQLGSLFDFSPRIAAPADFLTITGRNFSSEFQVMFGTQQATVVDQSDFEIRVRVPSPTVDSQVPLSIISADESLTFDEPFEYVIGAWESGSAFPIKGKFNGSVFLRDNNEVSFGLGIINTVWSSPIDNIGWTDFVFSGDKPTGAYFAGKFFGGGITAEPPFPGVPPTITNELWKFESGSYTQMASAPFQLVNSAAVELNGYIYVLGGQNALLQPSEEIYRYSISNNSWEYVGDLPNIIVSTENPIFSLNDDIYILDTSGVLFKFDTISEVWQDVSTHPEGGEIEFGSAFASGDGAYIFFINGRRTLYFYNANDGTWTPKTNLPFNRSLIVYGSWEYNQKIFVLLNSELTGNNGIDIWEFSPEEF